jgi:hypothetical protein
MSSFKVVFTVDGRRTEQTVRANTTGDARELVKKMFPNSNVYISQVQLLPPNVN